MNRNSRWTNVIKALIIIQLEANAEKAPSALNQYYYVYSDGGNLSISEIVGSRYVSAKDQKMVWE